MSKIDTDKLRKELLELVTVLPKDIQDRFKWAYAKKRSDPLACSLEDIISTIEPRLLEDAKRTASKILIRLL